MYSANGIALDDRTKNWRMLRGTQLITQVNKRLSSVTVPGRHGVVPGIQALKNAPTATIQIRCPGESVHLLYTIFEKNGGQGLLTLTDDTSRAAVFEVTSLDTQGITAFDELVTFTATVRFPTADWRETALSTMASTSVTDPVQEFQYFEGMTADIADMDIFVGGDFGNFELQDTVSGSWIHTAQTWPHVADTGLLYVGSTGQAFRAATASPWTPTADMSDYIDVSGGGFRITPDWDTDPSDTIGTLELTTTSQSGVTFRVRGYNAFTLRNGEV